MLTPRQSEILDFIRGSLASRGVPPTRAEIVTQFGFNSPTAADDHLRALARKGVIDLAPKLARGIRLREIVANDAGLPLIGRVAAGSPLLAAENLERRVLVDANLFKPRADYLLRVQGESMIDAGIRDKDLLVVHKTEVACNGQIVVARIGEEVTAKRFERRGDIVRLIPENPRFETIVINLFRNILVIEGLVVGVLRTSDLSRM